MQQAPPIRCLEKSSWSISSHVQTREQETTYFHIDIVILLTPFCSLLQDSYPPCSGFHRIIQDTARTLQHLGSLFPSKKLSSIKSLVVFEQRGVLCCRILSFCDSQGDHTDERWSSFETESLTLLEQQIESVYIPYLQKHGFPFYGVDLYDLLVLCCIYGGNSDSSMSNDHRHSDVLESFGRLLLITFSPSSITHSSSNDESKDVFKLMSRKGLCLDLVHVLTSIEEPLPNSLRVVCLAYGGNIWNSNQLELISNGQLWNKQPGSLSFQEDDDEKEHQIIATFGSWKYEDRDDGYWLQVFIQWHIQQGFVPWHEESNTIRASTGDVQYLQFYLLLNEYWLVICHIDLYKKEESSCTSSDYFVVHLQLRCKDIHCKKKDISFRRWNSLLACEQLWFYSFSSSHSYDIVRWLEQSQKTSDGWWKECPFLLFVMIPKKVDDDDLPVIEQAKNFLLSLYPGSIIGKDYLLVFVNQHERRSSFLLFSFVPVVGNDSRIQAVKVMCIGMGIFPWKPYLEPLWKTHERLEIWNFCTASRLSFFLWQTKGNHALWDCDGIEFLSFGFHHTEKIRISLWEEARHCWILPNSCAAHRVWQTWKQRLEKVLGWFTWREEENASEAAHPRAHDSLVDGWTCSSKTSGKGTKHHSNGWCWWIGAKYPLVVCLQLVSNQIKLYYPHGNKEEEETTKLLLDVSIATAFASYCAMDVVWDWYKYDQQVWFGENRKCPVFYVNDSLWQFATLVDGRTIKANLVAYGNLKEVILNADWMKNAIGSQEDKQGGDDSWLMVHNSEEIERNKVADWSSCGYCGEDKERLSFVKKIRKRDDNNEMQREEEWLLMGLIVVMHRKENAISLFLLSLYPMQWMSHEEATVVQNIGCRLGYYMLQQIKRNIAWTMMVEMHKDNALWNHGRWISSSLQKVIDWKPHRWSLLANIEDGYQVEYYTTLAMKCMMDMLISCGYHPLKPSNQDNPQWLRFEYDGKQEKIRVIAKVSCNQSQVCLEMYDRIPHSKSRRLWNHWMRLHDWMIEMLEKYLQLYFRHYCCFPSWILLDDMATFCLESLEKLDIANWKPAQVIEWRHQNVWRIQFGSSPRDIGLELHVSHRQQWPMECMLSWDDITKTQCWENMSFLHFLWSAWTLEYLQGEYIVQRWNQSQQSRDTTNIAKWILQHSMMVSVQEKKKPILLEFSSMEMEWKYNEISKRQLVGEWKRQLDEQNVELYTHENAKKLTCVGLVTANQLLRILSQAQRETESIRDYWILFILEMSTQSCKYNKDDSIVVMKTLSLPLKCWARFLSPNNYYNYTGQEIFEMLQEIEQSNEESKTWLRNWFSSTMFHLHQLQRWKVEIDICKNASCWNLYLFMDTFPHYSFAELYRSQFSSLDNNTIKIPKLPLRNQLDWDKIVNPTNVTFFSPLFQLLRRNDKGDAHVWYLFVSSQQDDVMLLFQLPLKEEPRLELILQSTDKVTCALRIGCQFFRCLIGQIWAYCRESWNDLESKLH